mmetsp:Transcript_74159/g.169858  ORF Transcript_74159/g.169858 Transcript_74159/m.169858 type:complete len:102 (+) Transcript_74159:130-435(+)
MIVERNHLERLFFQWRSRCSLQRKSLTGVEDEVARVQKAFLAVPRLGPEGGAEIGDWSDHTSENELFVINPRPASLRLSRSGNNFKGYARMLSANINSASC